MLNDQLHYKIDLALAILRTVPEFVRMGRLYSVRAAIDKIAELFAHVPNLYLFNSHGFTEKPEKKNEERLRVLLRHLQDIAAKEANFLQNKLKNVIMAQNCLYEIHANLSLMLHENAPFARNDEDNCLLNMEIPLCYLGLGDKFFVERNSKPEAFADYVLTRAWPRLYVGRLEYLDAIWLDFDISSYIGRPFNENSGQLNPDDLARLLSWTQQIMEDGINSAMPAALEPVECMYPIIHKLVRCLKRLRGAIDYELPEELLGMDFTAFLDCLKETRRHVLSWRSFQSYNEQDAIPNSNCIKNVERLDKIMSLLEPKAQSVIQEANHIAAATGPKNELFMHENNHARLGECTLWTRNNGFLSALFMALPLICVNYVSAALIGSEDNWTEAQAISDMRYLTHIFAHESPLSWHELAYADYVTIRVDFSRQLYRNFSNGI